MTILTQYQKVKDLIDIIKIIEIKLKYGVKNKDQFCSLLFILILLSV